METSTIELPATARGDARPAPERAGNVTLPINMTAAELAAKLAGRPAEHLATFEWFRDHAVRHGFTFEKAAHKLKKPNGSPYSRDSLKHAMYGFRDSEASLAGMCEAIENYRASAEMPLPASGFVQTRLAREIETYLERVKTRNKIGFIVGPNACGKSTALNHLDRTDTGMTVLRMPEGGHLSALMDECKKRRSLGDRKTISELASAVLTEFARGHKVVIDDAFHCFQARSVVLGNKTLDYLRRAYDSGWSLTLVMDPPGYKKLMSVEETDPLRRLYSRRDIFPLLLPSFYREDLDLFARRVGLTASPVAEHKVTFTNSAGKQDEYKAVPRAIEEKVAGSHRDGLFMWLGLLEEANVMAQQAQKSISWNWVLKSYALHLAGDIQAERMCAGKMEGRKA